MLKTETILDIKSKKYTPQQNPSIKNQFLKTFNSFCKIDSIYKPYETADILVVDDDPIVRNLFYKILNKTIIKKNEGDEGRNIVIRTASNDRELLNRIVNCNQTFGLILMDENLGPDSLSGTQLIKRLRNKSYDNLIVSISADGNRLGFSKEVKACGGDGIIIKTRKDLFTEIINILTNVVTRDFNSNSAT